MKNYIIIALLFLGNTLTAQTDIPIIKELNLPAVPKGQVSKYWLHLVDNGLSQPVLVPIIVAKGNEDGPVLGLTAAIHGNELNGIPVIQQVFQQIDIQTLKGTLVGVPGLNIPGMEANQREFTDGTDLNRIFPGKANGNDSQQYTYYIFEKIAKHFNVLIDMHTASFGRVNSMYVRADVADATLEKLAELQYPDIIVVNKGNPSAGGDGKTLRAEAAQNGIPCLTIEYGNPQVFQPDMTSRGVVGIFNAMSHLGMIEKPITPSTLPTVVCSKSYWLYTDMGGLLEVPVELAQTVKKGELIGILRNPFGDILKTYTAPENGVVIGKSSNPINRSGGRILHLGVQ